MCRGHQPQPRPRQSAEVYSATPTIASACIAVGDYDNGTAQVTLAERWNGTKWSHPAQPPNPTGGTGSELNGVSCSFEERLHRRRRLRQRHRRGDAGRALERRLSGGTPPTRRPGLGVVSGAGGSGRATSAVMSTCMDEGLPIAYEVLESGVPVYASGGEQVGTVDHVIAAPEEDIFHGIVIRVERSRRFVAADQIVSLHERGVDLAIGAAEAATLPEPGGAAPAWSVTSQGSGRAAGRSWSTCWAVGDDTAETGTGRTERGSNRPSSNAAPLL